jgi:hypothetical protein
MAGLLRQQEFNDQISGPGTDAWNGLPIADVQQVAGHLDVAVSGQLLDNAASNASGLETDAPVGGMEVHCALL